MRLSVLLLMFTQPLKCGKSSTLPVNRRLYIIWYQALADLRGHKNSYGPDISCSVSWFFFKKSMENESQTRNFSSNNQENLSFTRPKASCTRVSVHLGMEILQSHLSSHLHLSSFCFRQYLRDLFIQASKKTIILQTGLV